MSHPEIPFRQIAIEGPPRCQKTKLAQILSQMIGGRLVLDRPENPYLNDFYNEKDGASFLAQLVFLVNRYHQQLRLSQRDLFEERVISDYLFEKDKIYAYQTLGDDELVVYERIYGILSERIPGPTPSFISRSPSRRSSRGSPVRGARPRSRSPRNTWATSSRRSIISSSIIRPRRSSRSRPMSST